MKKITLLTCLFISVNIAAQPFNLVKEINTTATSSSVGNSLIQRVGTTVYYVANDGISGIELWKSDGTAAGSVLVKDINPGPGSTSFANFTAGDGLLFFTANDGVNGFELWRTDGTSAGTFMLREGFSECTFCLNRYFFHNGILYFAGDDGTTGAELWKSDGTVAGTVLVKDIFPGLTTSHPAPTSGINYTFVAVGNDLFFSAVDALGGRELFKTDGTAAGTVMVKDIFPGATSSISTVNHKAAAFNGKLYFAANDGVSGVELWATDGTAAGTYLVKDIVPGGGISQPNNLIAFNGALYFTASSTNNAAPDLWKTDGTDAGTVLVRSLVADGITLSIGNSATIDQFTVANGKLFFRGTGPTGIELYATDGTTTGTGLVKDIYPGVNGVNLNSLVEFNNNVYFLGTDVELPSRGAGLYKSDGTAAGTVQLTDGEYGGALGIASAAMIPAGGKLFFWGNTNDKGIELWSTDGTNANTALVKDINTIKTGTSNSGASAFGSVTHNGYYYYAAVDDSHGYELWKSDGTTAGTAMVKDIWPGKAPSNPNQFFVFNGEIYFTASNGSSGTELWKTDGTEAGTVLVADINPGPVNSSPNRFSISNNYLYFTAYHPSYGSELWRSNGSAAGTNLVLDLIAGPANGVVGFTDVVSLNNNAYAIMNIPAGNILGLPTGNRLIKIDGVSNTLSDFASVVTTGIDLGVVGNTLYITGRNAANQTLLWKSDNGGTVTQVKILSTTATNAFQLTNCGGKLYFSASNGTAAGMEPWISDGTDAGTYMLKDVNPGTNSSTPYQYIFSGGKVYFTASSTGNTNAEYELWATDGTTAGTYLVKDILPGSLGSRPNSTISAFGNKVLFTANDGASGYELWQSDGTTAGTSLLQEFNTAGDGVVPVTGVAFNFPTDYVYSKLGDKIVFFARSADKGLQIYSGSIASPYKYVNDNSTTNDVFTTAVGNNVNNGSPSAPYATLTYALSQASEGDTIYVDTGIFIEQVTIDKGITLLGAGSGFTIVLKPAAINPPPGTFIEPGTIQTAQNIGDVHIRDMSVTGDDNGVTPIILQTGGSVKYCRLIGGNQGIFFRVNPAVKSALIENNYINVQYIGINCAGTGLTATLNYNTIELNNPFFAAGVYAGVDFGPLVRFTAFGNIINNYKAQGILANSYNTNITQNSILGTGQYALEQGTNSLAFATCNWFGTTNAATIASKVSGSFSYTPFLTSGVNSITNNGSSGFVPVPGSCSEGVNNFYVNDNSRTNDVFTTAVGSNTNPGTSVAPFATLSHAISVSPANSVIHVDAGTFAEQVIIDRGIVINGAGRQLTSFVKPATPLVPPPGSFPEIGLFETTESITGDVHIRNISINSVDGSSQNIIIQSGGSVKNCTLLNGGQGVFFRIASGSRTATVDANIIQPTGIGINCQGAGLTATIVNNTISKAGGYYSAIFAGLDFGPISQLTIINNSISDYTGTGMLINSNGSNVSNNSILGTGNHAIQQASGNRLNASCNWFGSADPTILIPKIYGNINYSPWLTSGTDNDLPALGFQPLPGVCNARQNEFYVNDNSLTNAVFTTAIGDNNNGGAPAAPLATIATAIARAQAGDIIYVDAGTYFENIIVNKSLTLRGAKYNQQPGSSLDRGGESIIMPAVQTLGLPGTIIQPAADNITIDGFLLDGDNPSLTGGTNINGADVNIGCGIYNNNIVAGYLTVKNTIVKNVQTYGIGLFRSLGNTTGPAVPGNLFTQNRVDNSAGRGIVFGYNAFGNITNNYISRCASSGTWFSQQRVANINNDPSFISDNIIENCSLGMQSSSMETPASVVHYLNNEVTHSNTLNSTGIAVAMNNTAGAVVSNNKISGYTNGVFINVTNASAPISVTNNSFTSITNLAIQVASSYPVTATCNWYGSSAYQDIINKIVHTTGNYLPWLVNGNDNEPSTKGFQPVPGSCIGQPLQARLDGFTNVTCNGANNGTATITVLNGVAPFLFAWTKNGDPLFNSTIEDPVNFGPGTYHLTITDALGTNSILDENGVLITIDVTITEPPALTASASGTNITIYGASTGSATVTASGGTGAYSYLWNNAATTPTISNLSAGSYSVAVTDANGCTAQSSYLVTQPGQLIATAIGTHVSCYGGANGSATVSVIGGVEAYSYLWSNGANTASISNLSAGLYSVTVTDANGATAQSSYQVTEPGLLTASATGNNISCFNGSNGTASVIAGSGTAPYSYLWSNGAATNAIAGLLPGIYTVTVSDANGCTATAGYTVTQPTALNVTVSGTNASCNGSAMAIATGGTVPYSYLWNNGAISQSINNVPAGVYSVVVTDAKGCTVSGSFTITGNSPINPTTTLLPVSCFGGSNGSITVTGAGGTAPHTYNLNGSAFQPGNIFSNLPAGIYVVGAKDANGCSDFVTRTILQPLTALTVVLDSSRIACNATASGRLYITASGGSGTKTYSWTGPNGYTSTTQDPNNIVAGNYSVTVTDAKGCTAYLNTILAEYPSITITESITHVDCYNEYTGAIDATITGGTGAGSTLVWTRAGGFTATTEDISGLRFGFYTLTVTDLGSGCIASKTLEVKQPDANLVLTATRTNATGCNSLGTITASALGGTSPYQFSIDGINYQSAGLFTGLYAGTYTARIRDSRGCIKTKVLIISDNGSDEYEALLNSPNSNNNNKNRAAPISIGANIAARIGTVGDIDYYRLSPSNTWSGNYTLSFVQPSTAVSFYLAASNGTTIITASDSSATHKQYNNLNGTYFVRVSGSNSANCYQFTVISGIAGKASEALITENKEEAIQLAPLLKAVAYPNPHPGNFNIRIESPEDGIAIVELFTLSGQKLTERKVVIWEGSDNTVSFTGIRQGTIFYRVQVGKKTLTGKVIGIE